MTLMLAGLGVPSLAADRTPVVISPPSVTGVENQYLTFTTTASDPDGQPIEAMSAAFLPSGATFEFDPANTLGTFSWTPDLSQAGTYRVQISANNACRAVAVSPVVVTTCVTGAAFTEITVLEGNGPPILEYPGSVFVVEGGTLSFDVTASDPEGDPIVVWDYFNLPPGATATTSDDLSTLTFDWNVPYGQAGIRSVEFTAICENSLRSKALVSINVGKGPDREPKIACPASARGAERSPMRFTASVFDPDGDAIESFTCTPLPAGAEFSAGPSNVTGVFSWTPDSTQAGSYAVHLSASTACRATGVSGVLLCEKGTATVQITIENMPSTLPATAFVTNANQVIRLGSGKPTWCAQVEPTPSGGFTADAIDPASVTLSYGGVEILATVGKADGLGDSNSNGSAERTLCFSKEDLRALLGGLPRGRSTIELTLEGDLTTGDRFHATLAIEVIAKGPALATVAPNPLNPTATLTFTNRRAGPVKIAVFDLQGRLVRRLSDGDIFSEGPHEVAVDGLADGGARLPSGVYFYRVETSEGASVGRFVIAK